MKGLPASTAVTMPALSYASRAQARDGSGYGPPAPGWYVRGEVRGAFSQRFGGDPALLPRGATSMRLGAEPALWRQPAAESPP